MKTVLFALVAVSILLGAPAGNARKNPTSHHRAVSSKNTSAKTVHVRSYKRKDGTVVRAHRRRPPGTAGTHRKRN